MEPIVKSDHKKAEYITRERVLKLLSDEENARVSMAETKPQLADGEEYLDLENLEQGVRSAHGTATPMGRVLPRKAVADATWKKILVLLQARGVAAPHASAHS
jgi:hypothetical protein